MSFDFGVRLLVIFALFNVLGGYTILMPVAIIASRYLLRDICFAIFAYGDIYCAIFTARYLLRDSGFVTLCLYVQKKCRRNMRRISIFNFQFCFLCLCGLVFYTVNLPKGKLCVLTF